MSLPYQRNSMVLLVPPIDAGGRGLPLRRSALALLQLHSYLLRRKPSVEKKMCPSRVDLTLSDLAPGTQKAEFPAQIALSLHPGPIWAFPLDPEILVPWPVKWPKINHFIEGKVGMEFGNVAWSAQGVGSTLQCGAELAVGGILLFVGTSSPCFSRELWEVPEF